LSVEALLIDGQSATSYTTPIKRRRKLRGFGRSQIKKPAEIGGKSIHANKINAPLPVLRLRCR